MRIIWKRILVTFWIYCSLISLSISIDTIFLDLIHQNINDSISFNKFYSDILKDIRQHRSNDIVSSPINVEKIRSDNYNEDYLKNSCYETGFDLLYAHGYNKTDLNISINDLQYLLPAVLYSIDNPGCERQIPPVKQYLFFDVWILGLILIVIMKLIHLIIFFIGSNHLLTLTSCGTLKAMLYHIDKKQNSTDEIRFSSIKHHLWLGLSFNAFICGITLGTVIYHLIPHIYEIPNENYHYTYLLRGTIILCGIFLFFIVEKLLRFRFETDELHCNEPINDKNKITNLSVTSIVQMANIHETFHVHNTYHNHYKYSNLLKPLSLNVDNIDEEKDLQVNQQSKQNTNHISHYSVVHDNFKLGRSNIILYHLIYGFSNDVIYGCGLSTALAHNRIMGFILWVIIFSEGFRRHSQYLSSFGRQYSFPILIFSIIFLILGYVIGGIFIRFSQEMNINIIYIHKEYIYSVIYGTFFYMSLSTLISELNYFSQRLQIIIKTVNQTSKQQRLLKISILICQIFFLIIGVIISLSLAIIWRYYNRVYIHEYVCKRDPSRTFCHS